MELRQLEYFLAIHQAGSFSVAALKLGLHQSVLSRQVQALEKELGFSLYRRTGRGVELTPEGRVYESYARDIVDTHHAALQAIQDSSVKETQPVVVGLPASLSSVLAAGLVKDFKTKYPHTPLKILEGFSGHITEWLIDGRIDVAVLYDTQNNALSSLKPDPLLEDRLVLVGPPVNHVRMAEEKVSLRALSHLPLVLPSQAHGVRVLVDRAMAAQELKANVLVEIDSLYSSLLMVESGLGYTVVSFPCVKRWVEAKRIQCRQLVEPEITRKLVTAISPQRPSSRPVRAFASLLRQHVTKHFTKSAYAETDLQATRHHVST